jgi:endonuclease/exonuclease/phosphatase family metal-dependent hydrolase
VYKRNIYAVKAVEFVSDRMSYIILNSHWCDITVLNDNAPKKDKSDNVKDSLYEEMECVLEKFHENHATILLGDFNAKVYREDIFKLATGNNSLHKIKNEKYILPH